jgi:hypothetical protein
MWKCHKSIEQCQLVNKKTKEQVVEECGFVPTRHETLHLLQPTQKHPKQHHGM